MLRSAYDWCIAAAHKPYALWLMGLVAFLESSVFPVPPDAMLIPMALARPEKAWSYAAVCTVTSVAGGVLGYFIGAFLYDSVGHWLISLYGYGDKVEAFRPRSPTRSSPSPPVSPATASFCSSCFPS
jgi:membrane protein YqaA with SNARE-associated domain